MTPTPKGLIEQPFEYGNDFGSPDETYISSQFDRPVMVHRYPAAVKAFYMEPDPHDRNTLSASTSSRPRATAKSSAARQRIGSYDLLKQRIEEHNLPLDAFQWYLDLRRYGSRPPLRLRHGHRARRSLDLRPGTRPRDHSLRPHSEPDLPVDRLCPDRLRPVWLCQYRPGFPGSRTDKDREHDQEQQLGHLEGPFCLRGASAWKAGTCSKICATRTKTLKYRAIMAVMT